MNKGLLISFEGLDKVGKSTQVKLLLKHLKKNGVDPVLVREPGSTETSERIREILADRSLVGKISPLTEFLLYSASRAQLVTEIIKPAIERGEVVVTDRYYDSSTAYQGYGRGIDIGFIDTVNKAATDSLVPDLTILLVADRSISNSKENIKRFSPDLFDDRLEREFLAFRKKVQAGFLKIARKEKKRFLIVDASEKKSETAKKIAARVDQLLKHEI
jgi:dTMP kinase